MFSENAPHPQGSKVQRKKQAWKTKLLRCHSAVSDAVRELEEMGLFVRKRPVSRDTLANKSNTVLGWTFQRMSKEEFKQMIAK